MKKSLLHSMVLSLSSIALATSMSTQAEGNSAQADKKTAAEFWADFKQDSKQTWKDSKEAFKDGWIESKLETALILNRHLNPFEIDIRVDMDKATLSGEVSSEIEKELAENIALGVEGIDSVDNKITVNKASKRKATAQDSQERSFSQYVSDVSTTAAIKSELLASSNIAGLKIDVDTQNDRVTLSGEVKSAEQKALAQAIAAKQDDVKDVINNLKVKS